jgi:hypothetical protein
MLNVFGSVAMNLLLLCGGLATGFSSWDVMSFFIQPMDFKVESSHEICEQPQNNRCLRHYTILDSDNKERDFVPFGYELDDGQLKMDMHIKKDSYRFSYAVNDESQSWSYLWPHVEGLVLGVVGLTLWFMFGGPRMLLWTFNPDRP